MEFLWDDNATGKQNKTMDVREGWHEPQGDGRKKKNSSLAVVSGSSSTSLLWMG